jgi:hypothetical protein
VKQVIVSLKHITYDTYYGDENIANSRIVKQSPSKADRNTSILLSTVHNKRWGAVWSEKCFAETELMPVDRQGYRKYPVYSQQSLLTWSTAELPLQTLCVHNE